MPLAEETGLILPLGRWVVREACAQAARWRSEQGGTHQPLWISVNVSPRQLDDPDLPSAVAEAVRSSDLPAGTLALELTETALLERGDEQVAALTRLRDAGASLVLDDFGTGFSSLTHLTSLPIDTVKIDRSFVQGLPDDSRHAAVVAAVNALGAELGLKVIAEGVETPDQLDALRAMRCQAVQGFLLDRPAPAPSLTRRPVLLAS